eukprot:PLAT7719.1.p1 GENE.PLAT7719.1~~PLAT7719.1.p1  ORF type:complete len:919 (+),score=579.46 PLAT7719.1:53-2758(+)
MAHVTFDLKWQEAMADLSEQLHIEDPTLDLDGDLAIGGGAGGGGGSSAVVVSPVEAFQHWACLYIKYLQIFRKLEDCYDMMVHPQKRVLVKSVLEIVMARTVQLKHLLVHWNPVNEDMYGMPPDSEVKPRLARRPMPWEYVDLDDLLVDLKLPPDTLEVPIPRFFKEDRAAALQGRDRMVLGLNRVKHGVDEILLPSAEELEDMEDEMSIEEAIAIIQRNERGRQGRERVQLMKEIREDDRRRRKKFDKKRAEAMDTETGAGHIQKIWRGSSSRRATERERNEELAFLGMRAAPAGDGEDSGVDEALDRARKKRKTEQVENRLAYEHALVELHDTIREEEGRDIREDLEHERREWFKEQYNRQLKEGGSLDVTISDFYPPPPEEAESKEDGDGDGDGDGGGRKAKAKGGKSGKGGKGGKGKGKGKGGDDADSDDEKPPPLVAPPELTKEMDRLIRDYEETWLDKDESDNFQQKHDVPLAKALVRPKVEETIRVEVDKLIEDQIENFKMLLAGTDRRGKKKKGKKGKKKRALPGERLLSGMEVDQMLALLVEYRVVNSYRDSRIADLVGDFNYLGSSTPHVAVSYTEKTVEEETTRSYAWTAQDPSIAQIRQSLTEYAVLPLGSSYVKKHTPLVRSVLLYGPRGSGKSMLVEAVANETGAILFNLSPSTLAGRFTEKSGPTRLVHMVFTVAKDPRFAPAVIYIDEVDKMFSKKKGAAAARFKKDIMTYTDSLTDEHQVIVIGNSVGSHSTSPSYKELNSLLSFKDLRKQFDRALYVPFPNYSSRYQLWSRFICARLPDHVLPEDFDISSLSMVSEGYSAGSIATAVRKTLTDRRVDKLARRPLTEAEFLSALAHCRRTFAEDHLKFQLFTSLITGLEDRRVAFEAKLVERKAGDTKKKGSRR